MRLFLVVALAAAGLAWHECLLLVTAALAAQRLELWRIERLAPIDAWRIGVRCIVAGGNGLLGSVVLGAALLASAAGWWEPSHDHPMLTVGLIAVAGAFITAMQSSIDRFFAEAARWFLAVLVAAAGLLAAASGAGAWACAASGAGVAFMAWTSWRLASDGTSLLRWD